MSDVRVRAIRGATTVERDAPDDIAVRVRELLRELMMRNDVHHDDVISVIFTATPDLTSAFPATAARDEGFGDIPLLCATEIDVVDGARQCVRVLLHVYSPLERAQIRHTYLHGAVGLRDDLPE